MSQTEALLKQLLKNQADNNDKTFGNKGGYLINATIPQQVLPPEGKKFVVFYPMSDGSFGTVESNILGLSNASFKAGIPIYFNCDNITVSSGIGILYFG